MVIILLIIAIRREKMVIIRLRLLASGIYRPQATSSRGIKIAATSSLNAQCCFCFSRFHPRAKAEAAASLGVEREAFSIRAGYRPWTLRHIMCCWLVSGTRAGTEPPNPAKVFTLVIIYQTKKSESFWCFFRVSDLTIPTVVGVIPGSLARFVYSWLAGARFYRSLPQGGVFGRHENSDRPLYQV